MCKDQQTLKLCKRGYIAQQVSWFKLLLGTHSVAEGIGRWVLESALSAFNHHNILLTDNMMQAALETLQSGKPSSTGGDTCDEAAGFVLGCLTQLPAHIRGVLGKQLLIQPFAAVTQAVYFPVIPYPGHTCTGSAATVVHLVILLHFLSSLHCMQACQNRPSVH